MGPSRADRGSVAEGSDAFRRCWELSTTGQDDLLAPTGTGTWDAEEERRFWSQPAALDCAVERLEEPVRARALQERSRPGRTAPTSRRSGRRSPTTPRG
ncbi:hypothetical protein ACFQX8_26470 [Klenkia terrae]|uniref:hypothetical protein n=1 Tax=Klenkia terrae TaxID=1052259 RepID=UPI00361460A3